MKFPAETMRGPRIKPLLDTVAQRELPVREVRFAGVAQRRESVGEPDLQIVDTPYRSHRRRHPQPAGGRIILSVSENVRVAIREARQDRLAREIDHRNACGRGRLHAFDPVAFDHDVNIGRKISGANVK